jgi:hypothetical protein
MNGRCICASAKEHVSPYNGKMKKDDDSTWGFPTLHSTMTIEREE